MLTVLYSALLIYVVAITFDFLTGLIQLWSRHFNKPQQSLSHFQDADLCSSPKVASDIKLSSELKVDESAVSQIEIQSEFSVESVMPVLPSTVAELRLLAQKRKIPKARNMKRADLLAALAW